MKQLDEITKNAKVYEGLTTYQKTTIKDRLKIEWIYTSNALEGNGKTEHKYYPHPRDVEHLMSLWFDEFRDISQKNISLDESIKTLKYY